MEPTISPSTGTPSSTRNVWIVGGVVLAIALALVGRQLLGTDIVGTDGSSVQLSTDKLLYRTSSGSTVPVTVSVKGVTADAKLAAVKMTLSGVPEYVEIDETAITGTGSTVINGAVAQRYGDKVVIVLSGIRVEEDGPFLTIPLRITDDPTDDLTRVVEMSSDKTAGSQLISQVAIEQGGDFLSYPLEDGPFFRLGQVQESPSASPTPNCPQLPAGCDAVTIVDGCTVCASDGGYAAMCPYCPQGRQGAICPRTDDQYGYTCVAVNPDSGINLPDSCFTCPTITPTPTSTIAPTDCPLVALPDGTITHVCPTPTPTPTGSGTIVSPSPTPTSTGSGATMTPSPSPTPTPMPSPTTAPIQCSLPLRGDVNCDGRLTIADLVLVADFLAGKAALSQSQVNNANVAETAEGRVNLADVVAFASYFSLLSPTL